jgi:hypothetical protein
MDSISLQSVVNQQYGWMELGRHGHMAAVNGSPTPSVPWTGTDLPRRGVQTKCSGG